MKKGLFTLLILFLFTTNNFAQQQADVDWEYEPRPDIPFVIDHLYLDLNIKPESALIRGAGRYSITSRRPDLTEIVFNTADVEIQEISIDGNVLEYRVSSDSLIIQLPDTLNSQDSEEILIMWESSSPFGIHKDVQGHLWTSLNPKARHHWIPIPDHPEVATTLEAAITIPAEKTAVFNGNLGGDELISTDEKTIRWNSETKVPISGISLAIGNFVHESARSGVKEVSIYASENVLMDEVRSALLASAVSSLKEYERRFSFEFPYDALNIVVLPDHQWEEVQSGAGVIYLYQNLGSLPTQLKRGIAAQWLGNYHRYLNSLDHRYEFLKAALVGSSETEQLQNPDSLTSIESWNTWVKGLESLNDEFLEDTIKKSWGGLIQEFEGVTSWDEYASFWYKDTGANWEKLPAINSNEEDSEEDLVYEVEYKYEEMNSRLTLVFEAQNQPAETLVGLTVTQYSFMDTTTSEISFTGALDSVSMEIDSGVEYITLHPKSESQVVIKEQKPFQFLVRQLSSTSPEDKKQAAIQLRTYTENPDLQLALRDVLREEQNPEVQAELLTTLSKITKGASGTEQTFLDAINSEQIPVQLAGFQALTNYPDDENVGYSVQNKLISTTSDTVYKTALNTYQKIATLEEQLSLAKRLERGEESGQKTILALQAFAPGDTTGQSMTIADRYALGNFPYSIRKKALELLLTHEQSQDYWDQTLMEFQEDRDPRVRYLSLSGVKYLSEEQAQRLVENRAKEELDPRVFKRIQRLLD